MTTNLHVRGPAELLTVLPYQLRYQPQRSLVVVGLTGGRVGLVERVDLPAPEHVLTVTASVLEPMLRSGPDAVMLVGYEQDAGDSLPILEAMRQACHDVGLRVGERCIVRADRWFAPDCADPGCCPVEGRTLPRPADVPAVAEFVGREISPLPSRDAMAQRLQGTRPLLCRAVDVQARQWASTPWADGAPTRAREGRRPAELDAWARILDPADGPAPVPELPVEMLGRALASLADVRLRDGIIAWLCPGELSVVDEPLRRQLEERLPGRQPGSGAREAIADHRLEGRLVELCTCCSLPWAVAPLTLVASFAWWRGDGTLTRIALERALQADPGYRLALLLERMVDLSIRPIRASA